MKKLLLSLTLMASLSLNAGIQEGKIVAEAIRIENNSLHSVEINGSKMSSGETWWIYPSSPLTPFGIKDNTITIKLHNGTEHIINLPLANTAQTIIPFGSEFNEKKRQISNGNLLEFDIIIAHHWVFGQKVQSGHNFTKILTIAQAAVNAIACA